jgi:hypothetical protein
MRSHRVSRLGLGLGLGLSRCVLCITWMECAGPRCNGTLDKIENMVINGEWCSSPLHRIFVLLYGF